METENDKDNGLDFEGNDFEIEFKNVFFRYNDESDYVLKGISFKIRSNETTSLHYLHYDNGYGYFLVARRRQLLEEEIWPRRV